MVNIIYHTAQEGERMDGDTKDIGEWNGDLKIAQYGNSKVLRVTDACDILGIDRGDIVSVTIRRKD